MELRAIEASPTERPVSAIECKVEPISGEWVKGLTLSEAEFYTYLRASQTHLSHPLRIVFRLVVRSHD